MIDYEYARYELRTKVASRPKTVYTGVRDGNMARSVFHLFFNFFLFLVFVVIHVAANLDFYGVLYAEYSGNCQEVSAVVTNVSYYRDKVYVKARGNDGTAFSFKYGSYSGKPGNIVTVRYLKSNPEFAVAGDGSEQSADLITLVLFTLCLTLLHGKFKIDFCIHFAAVYFQSLSEIITGFVKIRIAPGKNAGIIKSRVTYRIRCVFCN